MLVLHAHFQAPSDDQPGGVILWAEDGRQPPQPSERAPSPKHPEPHPFAAERDVVRRAVETAGQGLHFGEDCTLFLWLPSRDGLPQASPHLVTDWADGAGRATIGAGGSDRSSIDLGLWSVPGVRLTLPQAVHWLGKLDTASAGASSIELGTVGAGGAEVGPAAAPPVHLADDLRYWQAACRLVLETLAAQKVLPALVTQGAGRAYQARWLPVLDDAATGPRLLRLTEAMPAVCRAGAAQPEDADSPAVLLEQFLVLATDALARSWLRRPSPRRGATRRPAGWRRWGARMGW